MCASLYSSAKLIKNLIQRLPGNGTQYYSRSRAVFPKAKPKDFVSAILCLVGLAAAGLLPMDRAPPRWKTQKEGPKLAQRYGPSFRRLDTSVCESGRLPAP